MTTRRQFVALTGAAMVAPALPAVSAQPSFLAAPYRGRDHYAMCCRLYGANLYRNAARFFDDRAASKACHRQAAKDLAQVRRLWLKGDPAAREAFMEYRQSGYTAPPIIP